MPVFVLKRIRVQFMGHSINSPLANRLSQVSPGERARSTSLFRLVGWFRFCTDSCGSSDSDSNFPYGSSSIQEYGFNPITGKIYNPATTHDLMSYCPAFGSKEGWIAPFTWMQMFNRLSPSVVAAAEAGATDATGAFHATDAASSLVVNATIFNPEAPDFNPAIPGKLGALYQINTGVELALAEGGYSHCATPA